MNTYVHPQKQPTHEIYEKKKHTHTEGAVMSS